MNKLVSTFEHTLISENDLPESWRGIKNITNLEKFLQSSWNQRATIYFDNEDSKKQQFLEFDHRGKIKTKNYVGTIIYNGEGIDIYPKIYEGSGTKPKIENLIKDLTTWLHYCDEKSYPFISTLSAFEGEKDTFEIFASVYLRYVEATIKKQYFMSYQEIRETGSNIKGKIDFHDYIINKIPTAQNHLMDYTYSAFIFDNDVNRIIKATCKIINRITKSENNKEIIRNILLKLDDISDVSCSPGDCDKVVIVEQRSCYKVIMQMSKMFLMNKKASGIKGDLDAFCFLFPSELLFEGFVGGIVKEMYKDYADVILQSNKRSHYLAETYKNNELIGNAFKLKEDIIIKYDPDFNIVLDTKYKSIKPLSEISSFRKLGIEDADMKQMATYAIENDAIDLYLVYPLKQNELPDKDKVFYRMTTNINDIHQQIDIHILRVPFSINEDKENRMNWLHEILWTILGDHVETK